MMRSRLSYFLPVWSRLCVASLLLLGLSGSSFAEEGDRRPWGRLAKPSLSAPDSTRHSGYLGRYNPWVKNGENDSGEPRYRKRDDEPSSDSKSYTAVPAYPPRQPYAQMPPAYPEYAPGGGAPYTTPPLQPYPGSALWGGGMNPDYRSYLTGPYNGVQPDRGILWSDMWR
jgi:hypothetical protein